MIVDNLKKSILKYAITGKLSCEEKNDSNIFETFEEIQKQRRELFDSKKITKQQYNIQTNNNDYSYEYPNHWLLTQIGYLGYVIGGGTPRTDVSEYWGMDYSWITPKDMKNFDDKFIDRGERSITKLGLLNSSAQIIPKGAILCSSRAPIGYLGISKNELTTNQGFKTLVPLGGINPEYIYYYLMARIDDLKKSGDGTTFSEISGSDLSKFHIVIPPIEEQKRIVDKIEFLFEKLDNINLIEEELNELKNNFPLEMKNSLLQSAIKGNLALNNINELPALDVKNYSYEKLFDIPSNWRWIKIDDVIDIQTGLSFKKTDQCKESNNALRILRGGNINNNFQYLLKDDDIYVSYTDKYIRLLEGDIITPSVTSMEQMGKTGYIDKELDKITAGGFVYIMRSRNINVLLPKYMMYFINSKFHKNMCKTNIHKSGQAFYNLKKSGLVLQPIPLPPIEEQQRIVDKLEQLLPLCDDIDKIVSK